MKNKTTLGIIILVVLVFMAISYINTYTILDENISSVITNKLGIEGTNLNFIKEENVSSFKALLFINEKQPNTLGLAILKKGINNRYKVLGVYNNRTKYTTARKNGFKIYIITAGDNHDGSISYLKFEDDTKIKIEKDFFVKIFSIQSGEVYNYYNDKNEVITWN